MRDRNGRYTSTDKEHAKARAYWTRGFDEGYAFVTRRLMGHSSASSFGRFGNSFSYGLMRGRSAGVVAREYGVDLSSVCV